MKLYKNLSEKEYKELSDKFLALRKFIRRLTKLSEEIGDTLFLNIPEHPEMREHRIKVLEKKLKRKKRCKNKELNEN